jgi:dihydrolipoamide dehydrogenase
MQERTVDVAIIGAGTAGLTARRAALDEGATVLMIDPGPLGTTCARVGCMPSKLLIAAADAAHVTREAELFGLQTTLEVDGKKVLERVQRERDRFVGFVLDSVESAREAGQYIPGRARFVDAHTLEVTDDSGEVTTKVEAKTIIIAAGTAPFIPPPFRGLGDRLWTNEEVFEQQDLPRRVLVLGAGVIGLELGQALSRLGTEVTLVDLATVIGPLRDPQTIAAAKAAFADAYTMHLGYQLDSVERVGDEVKVAYKDAEGARHERTVDAVLSAAGRRSNLPTLGLDKAGVELDERGQPKAGFDPHTMQIGETNLFIAGDITGDRPVLHEAADEGRIAGRNAARFPDGVVAGSRSTPLGVVFTEPQLAIVGTPFAELDHDKVRVGQVDYGDQGRARVMNQNKGLVRVYGELGSGRLLGAEMVGPRVENTAHLLAWAVQQELTVSQALEMPFYHPVVEEGIRTALRDLQSKLREA